MRILPIACLALLATTLRADDTAKTGGPAHVETEGQWPRREALLMPPGTTGRIHFPVTTGKPEAQAFFEQGVGQLHGFWYFEAERSFRQAARLDPECAMAYWGLAMASLGDTKRAREFIKKAHALGSKTSERERAWIDALREYYEVKPDEKSRRQALVKPLEKLSFEHPDDLEIKAFLVYQLWDNAQNGIPLASHQAVDAIARQILAVAPMHPVHHYLVHLWNDEDDRRALQSAARCGQSAPGIAHMWHMGAHTFTKLRRYADAVWQQEASARLDHAHTARWRILPEQIHNYAHNNEWLVENLALTGRIRDALDLARTMIELPRVAPAHPVLGRTPRKPGAGAFRMGAKRLQQILPQFELWEELCGLDGSIYLPSAEDPLDEIHRLGALSVGWSMKGDPQRAAGKIADAEAQLPRLRDQRYREADAAEKRAREDKLPTDQVAQKMTRALQTFEPRIEEAERAIAGMRLFEAIAAGETESAKEHLGKMKDLPQHRLALIHRRLGDLEKEEAAARAYLKEAEGQVLPLALLADVLWRAGKSEEAFGLLERLRPLASRADLDLPALQRLAPLAEAKGLPADWRLPAEETADSGVRPPLESLGPVRWTPPLAPAWKLEGGEGFQSLAGYQGRAVLVVFYLGSGCKHCIEQLDLLSEASGEFAAAGISVVAVGTETADALRKTTVQAKNREGFGFPILADPEQKVFKAYHCVDEFEGEPLHGAFLIDGAGFIRWQEISLEPFREIPWLIKEAKRLLPLPVRKGGEKEVRGER